MPKPQPHIDIQNIPTLDGELAIAIDVQRLIETRALVQANSGAGKSYTLRRLLEQTYGKVQHITLDVEGEFHTLRERFDYVLASPRGGDCRADVATAPLLARRLLELGASAIVDIYELGAQQARFVKLFLESLMAAPRDLWHPVLVVIDEAHKFCPEKSDSMAAPAVIDLMTRGRKRGFAGVLATQRLSKLDKDAAAEANNLIIGRTALDLDIARAASVLGMTMKDARAILPKLEPGEFYVVGPALTPTVERIHIGGVVTSHPKAGTRGAPPTPPRATVRAILSKLADLPAEAEQEAKTTDDLRAKIRELVDERDQLSRAVNAPVDNRKVDELKRELARLTAERDQLREDLKHEREALADVVKDLNEDLTAAYCRVKDLALRGEMFAAAEVSARLAEKEEPIEDSWSKGDPLHHAYVSHPPINGTDIVPAMHRAFLTALAQHGPLSKRKLLVYTGYARGGATSKAFADLNKKEWVRTTDNGDLVITDQGSAALGPFEPLPRRRALREKIERELADMERKMFQVVCAAYPQSVAKNDILTQTGYARGGATSKAFAYLVARDYLEPDGPGRLRAARELFE